MLMKPGHMLTFAALLACFAAGGSALCAEKETVQAKETEEERVDVFVRFRAGESRIDSTFMDNAAQLARIRSVFKRVHDDPFTIVHYVVFAGTASPEGSAEINSRLSHERLISLERLVRKDLDIGDGYVRRQDMYIPWRMVDSLLEASGIVGKEEARRVIAGKAETVANPGGGTIDSRILRLKEIDGGRTWRQMNDRIFGLMRFASVGFIIERVAPEDQAIEIEDVPVEVEGGRKLDTEVAPVEKMEAVPEEPAEVTEPMEPEVPAEPEPTRIYLKSNALAWGFAISNFAGEADLGERFSVALPVYYSAWNYFKYSIKFRTLAFQPEVRYWFGEGHMGWFAAAHLSLAYYNLAVDGDYRYQDRDGKTPSLGGGLAGGYRMPIGRDGRWAVEFTLGAGVYPLDYDKFVNRKDGILMDTNKKTYFGPDQAAVTFSYAFDLKRENACRKKGPSMKKESARNGGGAK